MTSKEILQADLLDIVFDNRNKSYGAYVLRKNYDATMMTALGSGLAAILAICLVVHFSTGRESFEGPAPLPDVIMDWIVEPDKPKPPDARSAPTAPAGSTTTHTTIQIAPDVSRREVPTGDELDLGVIGTIKTDIAGDPGTDPTQPVHATDPIVTEPAKEPVLIQRAPEFPGGSEAWMNFLNRFLTVPEELEYGVRKTVIVRFLVSEDGSITQFTVLQSGGKAFDNEVIRVLKKMPKWRPAVRDGKNISVTFNQTVTFQSVEE